MQQFYSIESRSVAHRGVVDSLTILEQSESIGRITTLAFTFIPLSFVTSVFGMDVKEFGSGPVSLKTVVKSGIVTTSLAVLLWVVAGLAYRTLHTIRRNAEGVGFRWRVLHDFAFVSPTDAFWLLWYGITHDPEIFTPLVKELGIWAVLGLGQEWERPTINTADQLITLPGFWQARANAIADITKVPGWQRRSYLQRRRPVTSNKPRFVRRD